MTAAAPSLKQLARACLARHRSGPRTPPSAAGVPGGGAEPAAGWDAQDYRDGFECAVVAWLNSNPPPEQPDPSRCLFCGEPERHGRPLLPILAGDDGHRWLHDVCWQPYWHRRRAEAAAALGGAL